MNTTKAADTTQVAGGSDPVTQSEFHIRDFGPPMTQQDIPKQFGSFFNSSKRPSGDRTGRLFLLR
jgi:hypothetical protein